MSKTLVATVIAFGLLGGQAVADGLIPNDPSLRPNSPLTSVWLGMVNGPVQVGAGVYVPAGAEYYARYNGHTYLIDQHHRVLRTIR